MEKFRNLGVIEPNYIVLAGIKAAFQKSDLYIALECRSLDEIWALGKSSPKLEGLLVDVEESTYPSDADLERLRSEFPGTRVILMAHSGEHANVAYALRHGIDGIILKTCQPRAILTSVELALLGERVFPAEVLSQLPTPSQGLLQARSTHGQVVGKLTPREIEVLKNLSKGHANKVIARNLDLSEATVKVHVKSVLRKSQKRNRTEAALWAREIGIAG